MAERYMNHDQMESICIIITFSDIIRCPAFYLKRFRRLDSASVHRKIRGMETTWQRRQESSLRNVVLNKKKQDDGLRVWFRAVNTEIDYKTILKYLIIRFILFTFH
jgi:hypothetical protein